MAIGWRRANHREDVGLLLVGQNLGMARTRSLGQGPLQTLLLVACPDPAHGGLSAAHGGGHVAGGPALIQQQQDPYARQRAGRDHPLAGQTFKVASLGRREVDGMRVFARLAALPTFGLHSRERQASRSPSAVAALVRQGAAWDHKREIRTRFTPAAGPGEEQAWHRYYSTLYYDIWSNIHYGYVGMACEFTADGLLDGAGLEQLGSDLVRLTRPRSTAGVSGMRRFDDSLRPRRHPHRDHALPRRGNEHEAGERGGGHVELSSKPYLP